MKRLTIVSLLSLLVLPGCGLSQILPKAGIERPTETPQFGVNFIRYGSAPTADIYADFETIGVETFRQLTSADIGWPNVEPTNDQWNFTASDEAIMQAPLEPIVTLFTLQYASPNPPWSNKDSVFQKTVGADARDYVETVVKRYKDHVKYWEIGNEMDHWRAFDPGAKLLGKLDNLPPALPTDGFSPEEQGLFLAEVSDIIRANDPDAVIVMPGMGGLSEYTYDTWLPGVLETAGPDTFDIVNYHFYSSWAQLVPARKVFQTKLETLGLSGKPVWLTETGSTSSPTLKIRTNYPNSLTSQVADIFRRPLVGFGHGDELVLWHTYIGSDGTANDWRDYGIISASGEKKPAYYAYKLFSVELLPFSKVEALEENLTGANVYKVTRQDGTVRYVAWGKGAWTVPDGAISITSVLPDKNNAYKWAPVPQAITLTDLPVLIK